MMGGSGDTPSRFGEDLFGGFVIGQAVRAATRTAHEGRRIHSLHGLGRTGDAAAINDSDRGRDHDDRGCDHS
jgi:acyl-CoA thioesterase